MNARVKWLLSEARDERGKRKWTAAKIAVAIQSGRCHTVRVLNNYPGVGHLTRRKLAGFFKREYPASWGEILRELGWDESGDLLSRPGGTVPRGTFLVEQSK